jgi:electron transfer flavoprotein alpha subunit
VRTLCFVESFAGEPTEDSLGLIALAATLGAPVDALVCGGDGAQTSAQRAATAGADRVLLAEDPRLQTLTPQPQTDVVASVVTRGEHDTVLFSTSSLASDVAAGVAARCEAGVNWDLVGLAVDEGELVGRRLALSDAIQATVRWRTPLRVALMRPGTLDPGPARAQAAPIERVAVTVQERSAAAELLSREPSAEGAVSLKGSEVIVAGGRGMGGPEPLELIRELADALDGAAAVSMPVVERGWAPYEMQVGQTGTVVRPRLYIACGISGQIQHRVGMERSGTIVAINSDESAPIVRFCDLAAIADLREVLPRLTELIRERGRAAA